MKLITIIMAMTTFFSTYANALNERIHCEGYFTAVINDTKDPISFSGEYIWDIMQNSPSYISLEGELQQLQKKYTVQRIFNVKVNIINKEDNIYELTPLKTTIQGEDNLPGSLAQRHLLHGPELYRIQKTLNNSYLVSNLSSPIFICHEVH